MPSSSSSSRMVAAPADSRPRRNKGVGLGESFRCVASNGPSAGSGSGFGSSTKVPSAGVGSAVQVAQIHFAEHVPPGPGGLLIANPPWGHRIGNDDAMPKMIAAWRSALGAWNGWSVAWILPDSVLGARGFDALGPGFTRVARCRHGGVPVSVGLRSATRR